VIVVLLPDKQALENVSRVVIAFSGGFKIIACMGDFSMYLLN